MLGRCSPDRNCLILSHGATIRGMGRSEEYNGPSPHEFRPERFLETERKDPASYVFGFGRRFVEK